MFVVFHCHLGIHTTRHRAIYVKTRRHPQNRKYIIYCTTPPEEDRARARGNVYKKFGEVLLCGFRVMRADRQTNRQTDTLVTIIRNYV